jgi:hypothetical protein
MVLYFYKVPYKKDELSNKKDRNVASVLSGSVLSVIYNR